MPSPRTLPQGAARVGPDAWRQLDFRATPRVVLAGDPKDPAYYAARKVPGVPDLQIYAEFVGGAVIRGSVEMDEPPCTLRVMDGADRFVLDGVGLTGSEGRGLRITTAKAPAIRSVTSWGHRLECVILGDCPEALVEDLECFRSQAEAADGYSADQEHGLYVSGDADRTQIRRLYCHDLSGSGLQVNGASLSEMIDELVAEDVRLINCGSGGTPALSMMAVARSTFRRMLLSHDRAGITMFADGRGKEFACVANTFEDVAMDGLATFAVHVLEGSRGSVWIRPVGFTPPAGDVVKLDGQKPAVVTVTVTPAAPSAAPPAAAPDAQIAALTARLAARNDLLTRFRAEIDALGAL